MKTASGNLSGIIDLRNSSWNQLTPVAVVNITNATQISAGYQHTCALLADNTIKCWGASSAGQLGNGITYADLVFPDEVFDVNNATQVSAGSSHTCALLNDSTIKCWGSASAGQLGNGTDSGQEEQPVAVSNIADAAQVSARGSHTCALLNDNTIKCWGFGYYGQLGNELDENSADPVDVLGE